MRHLVLLSVICLVYLTVNGQSTIVHVAELGIKTKGDNYFEILPNQVTLKSLDFSICLRCRFWTWGGKIVFSSEKMSFSLFKSIGFFHMVKTIEFPIYGLKFSPTLWNSICIVHHSNNFSVTIAINDYKETFDLNTTSFRKEDLKKSVMIGEASNKGLGSSRFSGQIADFNFWNKALTPNEIFDFMFGCSENLFPKSIPELVNWPNVSIGKKGLGFKWVAVPKEQICQSQLNVTLLILAYTSIFEIGASDCLSFNGQILRRSQIGSVTAFLEENSHIWIEKCYNTVWTDLIIDETSGFSECEFYDAENNKFVKTECNELKCIICVLGQTRSFFEMKHFEQIVKLTQIVKYTLINDNTGDLVFVGNDGNSLIEGMIPKLFTSRGSAWKLIAQQFDFFSPGINYFITVNNSGLEPNTEFQTKISNCFDDEFGCANGTCIPMERRCDGVVDCNYQYDETGCEMFTMANNLYQKERPPLKRETHETKVVVDVSIFMIENIDEKASKFDAKFLLKLKWHDWRITFINLKKEGTRINLIGEEDRNKIWIPELIFDNGLTDSKVEKDAYSSLTVEQSANGSQTMNEYFQENMEFKGEENALIFSRTYKMTFHCNFRHQKYPFDTQSCFIRMTLPKEYSGIALLDAEDHLCFSNEGELPQFNVIYYGMRSENNGSVAVVEIILKRIYFYHITNTYLPTSTLLMLAQATLHFHESHLELAIGLLLTVLLVIYTFYQSICASLTPTAYLKMIDFWLLFCLLMPFFSFMIEMYWLLQKKLRELDGTPNGWVLALKRTKRDIKKQKQFFLYFAHGITAIFLVLYFIAAEMMYFDLI